MLSTTSRYMHIYAARVTPTHAHSQSPTPKPGVAASSTTPAFGKDRTENDPTMSNPAERERESQESGQTKYEELNEQESAERRELAEDVKERLPERGDEDD